MEISLIISGAIIGVSIYAGISSFGRDMKALVFSALVLWNKNRGVGKDITLDDFAKEFAEARAKFKLFK